MFDCVVRRAGTVVIHGHQIVGRIHADGSYAVQPVLPALDLFYIVFSIHTFHNHISAFPWHLHHLKSSFPESIVDMTRQVLETEIGERAYLTNGKV